MSVVLGWLPMPFGGMQVIQQGFFDSCFNFITHDTLNQKLFGGYTFATCGYIPAGRNALVRTFLDKTDGDWLLMLDWDVTFTGQNVYDLIDAAEPDKIMSGCYVTFFGDGSLLRPCWFAEQHGEDYVPVTEFRAGEIVPLTVCGMGFTLMHREALLKMEKAANDDPWPWFGHDVVNNDRVGEDVTFCRRARACGLTIWGHGGVQLGHTKAKMLTPMDINTVAFGTAIPTTDGGDTKTVLNVGGASKDIPLPACYAAWKHILLDVIPGEQVDIVADACDIVHDDALADRFDAVYSSHNIEHYEVHDIPTVLAGFQRVLKPGGVVHVICPDFEEVRMRVESGAVALDDLAYNAACGPIRYSDMLFGYAPFVESAGEPWRHKTAITAAYLEQQLAAAGFVDVGVIVSKDQMELEGMARKPGPAPGGGS